MPLYLSVSKKTRENPHRLLHDTNPVHESLGERYNGEDKSFLFVFTFETENSFHLKKTGERFAYERG